jgi:hypothetical protein
VLYMVQYFMVHGLGRCEPLKSAAMFVLLQTSPSLTKLPLVLRVARRWSVTLTHFITYWYVKLDASIVTSHIGCEKCSILDDC